MMCRSGQLKTEDARSDCRCLPRENPCVSIVDIVVQEEFLVEA